MLCFVFKYTAVSRRFVEWKSKWLISLSHIQEHSDNCSLSKVVSGLYLYTYGRLYGEKKQEKWCFNHGWSALRIWRQVSAGAVQNGAQYVKMWQSSWFQVLWFWPPCLGNVVNDIKLDIHQMLQFLNVITHLFILLSFLNKTHLYTLRAFAWGKLVLFMDTLLSPLPYFS